MCKVPGVAGDPFHADNRMGLTGTLHRISAIRDRDGSVIGLTYRIGRHVAGMPAPLQLYPTMLSKFMSTHSVGSMEQVHSLNLLTHVQGDAQHAYHHDISPPHAVADATASPSA